MKAIALVLVLVCWCGLALAQPTNAPTPQPTLVNPAYDDVATVTSNAPGVEGGVSVRITKQPVVIGATSVGQKEVSSPTTGEVSPVLDYPGLNAPSDSSIVFDSDNGDVVLNSKKIFSSGTVCGGARCPIDTTGDLIREREDEKFIQQQLVTIDGGLRQLDTLLSQRSLTQAVKLSKKLKGSLSTVRQTIYTLSHAIEAKAQVDQLKKGDREVDKRVEAHRRSAAAATETLRKLRHQMRRLLKLKQGAQGIYCNRCSSQSPERVLEHAQSEINRLNKLAKRMAKHVQQADLSTNTGRMNRAISHAKRARRWADRISSELQLLAEAVRDQKQRGQLDVRAEQPLKQQMSQLTAQVSRAVETAELVRQYAEKKAKDMRSSKFYDRTLHYSDKQVKHIKRAVRQEISRATKALDRAKTLRLEIESKGGNNQPAGAARAASKALHHASRALVATAEGKRQLVAAQKLKSKSIEELLSLQKDVNDIQKRTLQEIRNIVSTSKVVASQDSRNHKLRLGISAPSLSKKQSRAERSLSESRSLLNAARSEAKKSLYLQAQLTAISAQFSSAKTLRIVSRAHRQIERLIERSRATRGDLIKQKELDSIAKQAVKLASRASALSSRAAQQQRAFVARKAGTLSTSAGLTVDITSRANQAATTAQRAELKASQAVKQLDVGRVAAAVAAKKSAEALRSVASALSQITTAKQVGVSEKRANKASRYPGSTALSKTVVALNDANNAAQNTANSVLKVASQVLTQSRQTQDQAKNDNSNNNNKNNANNNNNNNNNNSTAAKVGPADARAERDSREAARLLGRAEQQMKEVPELVKHGHAARAEDLAANAAQNAAQALREVAAGEARLARDQKRGRETVGNQALSKELRRSAQRAVNDARGATQLLDQASTARNNAERVARDTQTMGGTSSARRVEKQVAQDARAAAKAQNATGMVPREEKQVFHVTMHQVYQAIQHAASSAEKLRQVENVVYEQRSQHPRRALKQGSLALDTAAQALAGAARAEMELRVLQQAGTQIGGNRTVILSELVTLTQAILTHLNGVHKQLEEAAKNEVYTASGSPKAPPAKLGKAHASLQELELQAGAKLSAAREELARAAQQRRRGHFAAASTRAAMARVQVTEDLQNLARAWKQLQLKKQLRVATEGDWEVQRKLLVVIEGSLSVLADATDISAKAVAF